MMAKPLNLTAKITGMQYQPFLCRELRTYTIDELANAFENDSAFILDLGKDRTIALSWWVSAKRTRSYPYARVYDTLQFSGKRVTLIPIFKDEGIEGDRDFLQWDTVSLMSLLGVYTIVAYYSHAEPSTRYKNKITKQRFDLDYIMTELQNLLAYQSDALHWNLAQVSQAGQVAQRALEAYSRIASELGIVMHSVESAQRRIAELQKGRDHFMQFSRGLAQNAQNRELVTVQPKERLTGQKATLTVYNYLGGAYFFTCDEARIQGNSIFLIEGKHSKQSRLPSLEDIKDGLLKMMLFANLEQVQAKGKEFKPVAVLKLTSAKRFSVESLTPVEKERLAKLQQESRQNRFQVLINGRRIEFARPR